MTRRLGFAIAALAAWTLGSTIGAVVLGSAPAAAEPAIMVTSAHSGFTPEIAGDQPISILAIGSGARPYQDPARGLADSIHLIEIDPQGRRAAIIGIPRDSYVPIPGHGTNKINAAMGMGGPPLLVQTIEQLSGVRIQYFAMTSFWGLTSMIDQIGGLTIHVPFAMHDSNSRADFHAGTQHLHGWQVLAFSRDRHSLANGDFGRSENGGRVFVAALEQFRSEYRQDPSSLIRWVSAGMRSISTDLPLSDVARLALLCSRIPPAHVRNVVLPGSVGSAGGLSIVHLGNVGPMIRDLSRWAAGGG